MSNINETGYETSGIVSCNNSSDLLNTELKELVEAEDVFSTIANNEANTFNAVTTSYKSIEELFKGINKGHLDNDLFKYIPNYISITTVDANLSESYRLGQVLEYSSTFEGDGETSVPSYIKTYLTEYASIAGNRLLMISRVSCTTEVNVFDRRMVYGVKKGLIEIYKIHSDADNIQTSLYETDITKYTYKMLDLTENKLTCIYSETIDLGDNQASLRVTDNPKTKLSTFELSLPKFDYSIPYKKLSIGLFCDIHLRLNSHKLGTIYVHDLELVNIDNSPIEKPEMVIPDNGLESYFTTPKLRDIIWFDEYLKLREGIERTPSLPKLPPYGLQNYTTSITLSLESYKGGLDSVLPKGSKLRSYLRHCTTDHVTLGNTNGIDFYPVYVKSNGVYNVLRSSLSRCLDPYDNISLIGYFDGNRGIYVTEEEHIELVLQECRLRSSNEEKGSYSNPMYVLSMFNYIVEYHSDKYKANRTPKFSRITRGYSLFISKYEMEHYTNCSESLNRIILGNFPNGLNVRPVIIWGNHLDDGINLLKDLDIPSTEHVGIQHHIYRLIENVEFSSTLRDNWVLDDLKRNINLLAFGVEDPYSIKKFENGKPDYTISKSIQKLLNWKPLSDRL